MSAIVKGCRTPAIAERLPRARGQVSDKPQGRKPREECTRRISERGLWGFEVLAVVLARHDSGSMTTVLGAAHAVGGHPSPWCRFSSLMATLGPTCGGFGKTVPWLDRAALAIGI